jgi:hypothetical protein
MSTRLIARLVLGAAYSLSLTVSRMHPHSPGLNKLVNATQFFGLVATNFGHGLSLECEPLIDGYIKSRCDLLLIHGSYC